MASPFARASAVAERGVVRTFGERFRLIPVAAPTTAPARYVVGGADPGRMPREIVGVFSDNALPAQVEGAGANSRANADVLSARYRVHFPAAAFASEPPPRKGDRIEALDQAGVPVFKIAAVEPSAPGAKLECLLVEVGPRDPA